MTHKCWSPWNLVFFLSVRLHSDEEELRKSFSELGDSLCDSNASRSMKRVGSSGKPLSDETEPSGMLLYKNGFLVRKVHADCDGKRSTSHSLIYTSRFKIYLNWQQQRRNSSFLFLFHAKFRPDPHEIARHHHKTVIRHLPVLHIAANINKYVKWIKLKNNVLPVLPCFLQVTSLWTSFT